MSDQDIFRESIEKAKINGYKPFVLKVWIADLSFNLMELTIFKAKVRGIIFDHDFAKQFWGEKLVEYSEDYQDTLKFKPAWKYYQHKMLDEVQEGRDPLKYLEKFL